MNHRRPVRPVIGPGVFQLESFRQVIIELNGPELPLAANTIPHHKVRLGTVKRRLTLFNLKTWEIHRFGNGADRRLSLVPSVGRTNIFLRIRIAETKSNSVIT